MDIKVNDKNMINKNELRIGNLVLDEDNDVVKVCHLASDAYDDFQGETDNDFEVECPETGKIFLSKVLNPIPLTEEWLLNLGFEKIPHFTIGNSIIKSIGRARVISVSNIGTPNLMVYICETENGKEYSDLICVHNWDYDKEMYVHQLQNLYFALTGTELTLTKL